MRQRQKIQIGAFAAKRQFESGFSVRIAMALTGVATRLREHSHHIIPKGNRFLGMARQAREQRPNKAKTVAEKLLHVRVSE
jgi:hypothetical protein